MSESDEEIIYQINCDDGVIEVSELRLNETINLEILKRQNEEQINQVIKNEHDLHINLYEHKLNKLNDQIKVYESVISKLKKDLKTDKFAQPVRSSKMATRALFKDHNNVSEPVPIPSSDDELSVSKNKTDKSIINTELVKPEKKHNYTQIKGTDNVKLVAKNVGVNSVEGNDETYPIDTYDKINPVERSDDNLVVASAEVKRSKVNFCKPCPKSKKRKYSEMLNNYKKQKHSLNLKSEHKATSLESTIISGTNDHEHIQTPFSDKKQCKKKNSQLVPIHNFDSDVVCTKSYTIPTMLEAKKEYPPPFPSVETQPLTDNIFSAPNLFIKSKGTEVTLIWDMERTSMNTATIKMYEVFVCQETDLEPDVSMWKLVDKFKAILLPMRCQLDMLEKGFTYHFAVRTVDENDRRGLCSVDKVTIS